MPQLFIVAGASGAGKSFLLQHTALLEPTMVPIKKLTTRGPRSYETTDSNAIHDLEFNCSLNNVTSCDYRYHYAQTWYGIQKRDIDTVLEKGNNPIVIIRNSETIRKMKRDYPNSRVIYLQSGLSGEDLRRKLEEQGRADIEITDRMKRLQTDFHDYISHLQYKIFDHVIVNYYERDSLLEQLQAILAMEFPMDPVEPGFVFVLMSFLPDMGETYKALQTAAELIPEAKLRIERIDIKPGDYRITDEILRSIERAALVVCDLTHERPNVYYELGYARGLGKTVLHCAKAGTTVHFDIHDFHTIFYASSFELQEKMRMEFHHHFAPGQ